jgi:hypothetical protein
MLLLSGDHRGFDAFQPAGNSGRPAKRKASQLRRCSGCRLVGGPANLSPMRTIHNVLFVSLPSTVPSEYTTHSLLGEICASLTVATRKMSAG